MYPWFKRLSYVLAGGVAVGAGGVWFAHSSVMKKVYIRAMASKVKDVTGLDFSAEGMSFSVFKGRVSLYRPSLGADLFNADEISVAANIMSLLGNAPHILNLTVVNPVSNISATRLNQIKLKQSDSPAVNWILDSLEIRNGSLFVKEPAWGVPRAEVRFSANAVGLGSKKLRLGAECSRILIANESGALEGIANFQLDIDDVIKLRQLNFDSELLKLKAEGMFDAENSVIQCGASGSIFSQNLEDVFGERVSGFSGRADFQALVSGEAKNPKWTLQANAQGIQTPYKQIDNCSFVIETHGNASEVELKQIRVWSGNTSLTARGAIKNTDSKLILDGRAVPLNSLANMLGATALESITADIRGTFSSPAPIWSVDALSRFDMNLNAALNMDGNAAGNLAVIASEKSIKVDSFNLNVPELNVSVDGDIGIKINETTLSGSAIASVNLKADLVTTAEQASYSLDKWKLVDRLPISGGLHAAAQITWSPSRDLQLNGSIKFEDPVYFGATADILTTDVRVESKQLFLDNIRLNRKEAQAAGHLWLTWARVPEGAEQISMRYESFGLPLSEGLETGISNIEILEAMDAKGYVDGWVALSGPYKSMVLRGEANLYNGSIYGISIPAFSSSIEMGLEKQSRRLVVPEFRLADSRKNLDSLSGPLGLKGSLDIDLTSETWSGQIDGMVDSRSLGMANAPHISAQVAVAFDGPYAADYGSISLPEGTVSLRDGRISFGGNKSVEGLLGNISLRNGQIQGAVRFQDFLDNEHPLIQLSAQKSTNALQGRLNVTFSPETANTKYLAQAITKDSFEDIRLGLSATGRLGDRGLTWRADIDTFSGRFFNLDFDQQSLGSIEGNSERIRLAFDIGSQSLSGGGIEPLSRLRVGGTFLLGDMQTADFTLVGTADLEQTRNMVAGVFGESPDVFLAGFLPVGVGIMDLRLHGPYNALGLDGALQIRRGRLQPGGDFPYGIDNLNLDLICEGRRIALKNFDGRMARGRLRAEGDVVWNNSGVESYQVHTQLEDFQYHYKPEGFQLGGSIDAILHSIPGGKGEIRGNLRATSMAYVAEIHMGRIILNNATGTIPGLQNIDFGDPMDAINLDLDVDLTQPWIFDTNLMKVKGISTERFKILGTLANPGLRGRMELVPGGRITNILPAGDIIVEKGSIDFTDPNVLNPVINIQGQIDVTPFRVNLNVQGPLDSLNITPTSTPTLRQDEVISILLNPAIAPTIGNSAFNNSLSSLVASSGLTSATSGLLTNLASALFMEPLRRTLKLDRASAAWRVGTGGAYETDVLLGKNLNLMDRTIPVTGNFKWSGDMVTIGGQMEWRFGNLVINLGASGSRTIGVTPSGEIRYQWSSW